MIHALNRMPLYNCPSVPAILAPNGSSTLVDGRKTYTSDYHGVAGPKGTNPATATPYGWDPNPSGQGGFATQGVLGRDSKVRIASISLRKFSPVAARPFLSSAVKTAAIR